jgi:hypothetical protein
MASQSILKLPYLESQRHLRNMRMIDANEIKIEIGVFLRISQISDATFGRYAMNDPAYISRLSQQASMHERTATKLRTYMLRVLGNLNHDEKNRLAKTISCNLGQLNRQNAFNILGSKA